MHFVGQNPFDIDLMEMPAEVKDRSCHYTERTVILILFLALNVTEIKVHCLQCRGGDNKEH